MAVLHQGGRDPNAGKSLTTRGYKDRAVRQCGECGLDKPDDLFTMNANGKFICPDCAGAKHAKVLANHVPEVEVDPSVPSE